jgi:hypothetical protein
MTSQRQDLLEALSMIQNHEAHSHHDIMTITACGMSDDEVRAHLEWNMAMISRWSEKQPKRSRRRAA